VRRVIPLAGPGVSVFQNKVSVEEAVMRCLLRAVSPMLLMFVVVAALGQSSTPPDGREVEAWLAKTMRISQGEQPASANTAAAQAFQAWSDST
jgi:hypothetical protein